MKICIYWSDNTALTLEVPPSITLADFIQLSRSHRPQLKIAKVEFL